MKAMIFAAGLGTRLKPLTNDRPKALVEINGKTLLEIVIKRMISIGVKDIVVNIHHFGDLIIDFLNKNNNFGINIIISDERDELLDTGGGLKKVKDFFNDENPFLVYNVDVLCDIDINEMLEKHKNSDALATLAVRDRETSRYFLFDKEMNLSGWQNIKTGDVKLSKEIAVENLSRFAFSGIHIISPKIFNLITEEGKFSITNTYLELAKDNKIIGYNHTHTNWMDVGRKEHLSNAVDILGEEFFRG